MHLNFFRKAEPAAPLPPSESVLLEYLSGCSTAAVMASSSSCGMPVPDVSKSPYGLSFEGACFCQSQKVLLM